MAGGAIYAAGSLDVTIVGSQFLGNSGSNAGAVGTEQSNLRVYNSEFTGNAANGVSPNSEPPDVASCPGVNGPRAMGCGRQRGAILIDGSDDTDVIVCGSTFAGNRANGLAGALFRTANIAPRRTSIDRSTFQGNAARQGGALFIMNSAPLDISATTFSANSAVAFGAAHLQNSQFSIVEQHVLGQPRDAGRRRRLVLERQLREQPDPEQHVRGQPGAWRSRQLQRGDVRRQLLPDQQLGVQQQHQQRSVEPDAMHLRPGERIGDMQWPSMRTIGGGADLPCVNGIAFADPLLGPLANNGGPTATHLPAPGSPLRGAGHGCPATDQRGNPRNAAHCTIGAVE